MTRVGLVVVAHSAALAAGVVEVAAQMAPRVAVLAAGGTAAGGIGTDFDAVAEAVRRADTGAGVVLLYDLGSARMVADLVVEAHPDPDTAVVVDAPLVEGAVAAAVAADGGATRAEVAAAARAAAAPPLPGAPAAEARAGEPATPERPATAAPADPAATGGSPGGQRIEVRLTNEIGLHARPAALLARTLSEVDAEVTVSFAGRTADGTSVLALMGLGARGGDEVSVVATGPGAADALRAVRDLAARGFDE